MTTSSNQLSLEYPEKQRFRLWVHLLKLSRDIEGELREKMRTEFNSTLPRFDVLAALYQHPKGMKMSELSGVLKVTNGNVTGIVDRLVKDGMITRDAVAYDRRALLVCLTQQGKIAFTRQAEQHEQWIDELLSGIPLDDADTMLQLLERATPIKPKKDDGA